MSDSSSWGELIAQVPGMAVLAGVVALFLKAMAAAAKRVDSTLEKQAVTTQHCVDKMAECSERTAVSLDRNTEILHTVGARLDQLNDLERKRLEKE